ncbi:unnamed protein product, partial [Choristocarpus tenellus]
MARHKTGRPRSHFALSMLIAFVTPPTVPIWLCSWEHGYCIIGLQQIVLKADAQFLVDVDITPDTADDTTYCPVEAPAKRAWAPGPNPFHGSSCEHVLVEVRNESDQQISVFWVDVKGEEIQYFSLSPDQSTILGTCSGHHWRARARASGRLLSEREILPSPPVGGGSGCGTPSKESSNR